MCTYSWLILELQKQNSKLDKHLLANAACIQTSTIQTTKTWNFTANNSLYFYLQTFPPLPTPLIITKITSASPPLLKYPPTSCCAFFTYTTTCSVTYHHHPRYYRHQHGTEPFCSRVISLTGTFATIMCISPFLKSFWYWIVDTE